MKSLYQVVYTIFNESETKGPRLQGSVYRMMFDNEELLEVVNREGKILRILPRSLIHGDPSLMHRVVHVLVFNDRGELFLQKRSMDKDVAPGKWDTSVGGHVNTGETLEEAVGREMKEELGITGFPGVFLYSYVHSNPYETELVYTYSCMYDGEIAFNRSEIDDVRPWSMNEISEHVGKGLFSDNFEHEFKTYLMHKESTKRRSE